MLSLYNLMILGVQRCKVKNASSPLWVQMSQTPQYSSNIADCPYCCGHYQQYPSRLIAGLGRSQDHSNWYLGSEGLFHQTDLPIASISRRNKYMQVCVKVACCVIMLNEDNLVAIRPLFLDCWNDIIDHHSRIGSQVTFDLNCFQCACWTPCGSTHSGPLLYKRPHSNLAIKGAALNCGLATAQQNIPFSM